MSDRPDWWLFLTAMPTDDLSLRIAQTLRGNPSREFLEVLADLFDPPSETRKKRNYKVTLSRTKVGRSRAISNELGEELAKLIDDNGESVEATVAEMRAKYGVSRAKCFAALRHEREMRELYAWVDAGFPNLPKSKQ